MLTRIDLRGRRAAEVHLPRPTVAGEPPTAAVQAILAEVRSGGDEALRRLTARFDRLQEGTDLAELRVPAAACRDALDAIAGPLRDALTVAKANVESYHRAQVHPAAVFANDGVTVRELARPVDRAGCYVPGGHAPLLSTVLMTAIPAQVAGVPEIVLCTPPRPDGTVAPEILAAAALVGVDEVYRVGGAQAIAAMAYGTESIRPVDVIVGPGNVYVSVAKREVAGVVGVPSSFAGPSEVVVVADASTDPEFAAIDLMVQVEHGPDSVAWLIAWDDDVADRVVKAVEHLLEQAPRRDVIGANLQANSYVAMVDGPDQAMDVANLIAPEHLELMTDGAEGLLGLVRHAGAVFCGHYAPASVGDYLAGPNHVLPTYGSARFAGALRVDDFVKHVHVVSVERQAMTRLAPHVAVLAEAEGLATHARSARMRAEP